MKKKIIIVAPSGAGKDYLLSSLLKKNLKYVPKITTRPKRSDETEGVTYEYTTNNKFEQLIKEHKILCYQKFFIKDDIWYYGLTKDNYMTNDLFIMTPFEIEHLSLEQRAMATILYINIPVEIRRKRIAARNDNNDAVDRRIESDNIDFQSFTMYDHMITDPFFDVDDIFKKYVLE